MPGPTAGPRRTSRPPPQTERNMRLAALGVIPMSEVSNLYVADYVLYRRRHAEATDVYLLGRSQGDAIGFPKPGGDAVSKRQSRAPQFCITCARIPPNAR